MQKSEVNYGPVQQLSEPVPTLMTEANQKPDFELLLGVRFDFKEEEALRYRISASRSPEDTQIVNEDKPIRVAETHPLAVFLPEGRFLTIWSLIKDSAIIYSLVTTMYFLAFAEPGLGMFIVDVIVWVFFVVDVPVCFASAYENEKGRLITKHKQIAEHYVSTWFLLDVLAIIPLQFADLAEIEYYFRLVRLLKISSALSLLDGQGIGMVIPFVMTRILKFSSFVTLTQKHFAMIFNFLLLMIFLTYSLGCLWFWYSEKTRSETAHLPGIVSMRDRMPGTNPWEEMERCWYFMITTLTTIGYGDFGASNICEMLLLMAILLIGVTVYSYIISNVGSLVGELNELVGDRVSGFVLWLKQLEAVQGRLSTNFKRDLIAAFTYYDRDDRLKSMANQWWKNADADQMAAAEDAYLGVLPEELEIDVKKHLFSDVFGQYRSYFGTSNFVLDICVHFHPRHFEVGEVLLEEGENVSEVLFQLQGHIGIGPRLDGEISVAVVYESRCVVGDYAALRGVPSFTNYKAVGTQYVKSLAVPALVFVRVLAEKYLDLANELHIQSTKRFNELTELIKDHFSLEQKKRPEKSLVLDTRYWIPSVEKILNLQRSNVNKERDFVLFT